MIQAERREEHRWLERLVGEWTVTSEMPGSEGGDPCMVTWSEGVRSLGGVWVVAEGSGETPDGGQISTLMTLGFDPRAGAYVGNWIGSMMTHMWVYRGSLDEAGKVLSLDCEGPDFENPGRTLRYRDVITIIDDDRRTLTGRIEGADGTWRDLMVAQYVRSGARAAAA